MLQLMTIHESKGLEFKVVITPGVGLMETRKPSRCWFFFLMAGFGHTYPYTHVQVVDAAHCIPITSQVGAASSIPSS